MASVSGDGLVAVDASLLAHFPSQQELYGLVELSGGDGPALGIGCQPAGLVSHALKDVLKE